MEDWEIDQELEKLGWSWFEDEVDDTVAHFILTDRTAQIIHGKRRFVDGSQFEAFLSLSTPIFSKA